MLFERFEVKGLAQYSYAVGCPAANTLAIVDPRRDVDIYLEFAEAHGGQITHVLETHIHADFASGARELAQRSGARLMVSGHDLGETYEVSFPHTDMLDGESVQLGSVRIQALHSPGHTPEHLAFLVYAEDRSTTDPELLLSGDFLFVGSLGRPDLLGEAAKLGLARQMFDSVRERLAALPDGVEVHPGHGAGSMCGAGMRARPSSTLGTERIANPYLDPGLSREAFVDMLLGSVPPLPNYYLRMKLLNSEGPGLLENLSGTKAISADRFRQLAETDHLVIDLRDPAAFGRGHVPGSFGIGAGDNLSTWAAWVIPPAVPLLLVADDAGHIEAAVRSLARVGLDDVAGYLEGGMEAWSAEGLATSELPQLTPEDVRAWTGNREAPLVLDVRSEPEWTAGHIAGAVHIMGGELAGRVDEVPRDGRTIVVTCEGGYRATVAASLLLRAGIEHVANLAGGMTAWRASA